MREYENWNTKSLQLLYFITHISTLALLVSAAQYFNINILNETYLQCEIIK
jgi:hypothetical protein